LIVGPCGAGKSHIAQALGHAAIRAGRDVLFSTADRMLTQLHAARATNSYEKQLAKLAKIDLLIIDDFGLKPLKGIQDEDFHDVISERYERKARSLHPIWMCRNGLRLSLTASSGLPPSIESSMALIKLSSMENKVTGLSIRTGNNKIYCLKKSRILTPKRR